MADLIALGKEGDSWRRTLPANPVTLGRTARSDWDVPWDKQISGLHATLTWQGNRLQIRKDANALNSIFVRGAKAGDEVSLAIGEQFVIGATTFTIQETEAAPNLTELTCSAKELSQIKFTDADKRIEVLAALPGIIRYSPSNEELENRVVDALLRGIPRADGAAVVWLDPAASATDPTLKVACAVKRAGGAPLQPSRRLVFDAIRRRRQSVLHRWMASATEGEFTQRPGVDWAIAVPLPDDPFPGWCLYVTGHLPPSVSQSEITANPELHKSDLKFTELVAEIFGALRQVRALQSREATLASFLSRPVLAALVAESDMAKVLQPRETAVTVLFCDLRGSCRIAEAADSDLMLTCNRVSEALSIMTTNIIDKDGVIGDFQGDAAMGFWGWPLDRADQIEQAARAALAIRRDLTRVAQRQGHPLEGFACGIGIAHGAAVAGKLGTLDQFKVSVFGPVVNLASRLESMTKYFKVPILIDDQVGQRLRSGQNTYWTRCRRLARVQPFGMAKTLEVSELLPPAVEAGALTERDRRDYEAALDAFESGRWSDARGLLDKLQNDVGAFLKEYMDRHGQKPPADWSGVIVMNAK